MLYSHCLQKDNSNVIDQDHFTDGMVAFGFGTEKKKQLLIKVTTLLPL